MKNKIYDLICKKIEDNRSNHKTFLDRVFGDVEIDLIKEFGLSIFGAGIVANELVRSLQNYKIHVSNFVVSRLPDETQSQEIVVINIERFIEKQSDNYLLIGISSNEDEIVKELISRGVGKNKILRLNYDLAISAAIADPTQTMVLELMEIGKDAINEKIKNDANQIERAYNCLADERSKSLFIEKLIALIEFENVNYLGAFLAAHSEPVKKFGAKPLFELGFSESYFYFNNEFNFCKENKQSLVDIGAYDGCSTIAFSQMCLKENLSYQVTAFEPDPNNMKILLKNTEDNKNVVAINAGIWSSATKLRFKSSNNFLLKSSSEVNENGDIYVDVAPLQEFKLSRPVTILKADPPRLEVALKVLNGCHQIIKEDLPILIFPAYHSFDAIYKMPLAINSLNLGYKIYIRHLSWSIGETDVFAIPAKN